MELSPREFELLLCEFCKQDLPPNFIVEHDVREIGGESSGKRQIDTKITGRLGISNILICGEAKNWSEEVGSEAIDALVGKYLSGEIRANKVIMFSNHGYTAPAIARAKHLGIELLEPQEIDKPIKPLPHIIGIGYMKQFIMRLTHNTPQHNLMSLNPDDYTIIQGNERLSFQQFMFRHVRSQLRLMGPKYISTEISKLLVNAENILYELKGKEGYLYNGDFEVTVSLIWDYFFEYLPTGLLHHINTGNIIFVNLQADPLELLNNVLMSPTKGNYESMQELEDNVIKKSTGVIFTRCMPDPERNKTDPENPIFCFI